MLKEAQRLGYAEADPTFDIEGVDAAHKATIMSAIAFGIPVQFDKAHVEGITRAAGASTSATPSNSATASSCWASPSVASRASSCACTRRWCRRKRLIANVEGAMNAVVVQGDAVGTTLYYGKGAGAEPTASAVVADLVDITRLHTADPRPPRAAPRVPARPSDGHADPARSSEVVTAFYLRLRVADEPGVLSRITTHPGRARHLDRRRCCSARAPKARARPT